MVKHGRKHTEEKSRFGSGFDCESPPKIPPLRLIRHANIWKVSDDGRSRPAESHQLVSIKKFALIKNFELDLPTSRDDDGGASSRYNPPQITNNSSNNAFDQ